MEFGRFSFLFCVFVFVVSPVMGSECNKEEKHYDAYASGLKVQSLISNEDLSGIFSLVQGELRNGPRKAFITN